MHSSHAYLAWVAIEVCDGVYVHQLVGKLKPGDIPAEVRVQAIDALVSKYFRKERVVQGGYPMEMRYAGPREALLHAVFRQNYGCSHLIVGRDHAGVGDYYGPFDAQKIFAEIPQGALVLQPLAMDWTFYCYECGTMASMKTCPHETQGEDRRRGPVPGRRAPAALGHAAAQADERGQAGAARVQQARGDRDPQGVLRRPRDEARRSSCTGPRPAKAAERR